MNKSVHQIKFRRRREAVTNYKRRLELVKSGLDRVVLRKTNKRILAQIVKYTPQGDMVLAQVDSSQLSKYNWPGRSNRSTAYLTGLLLAKKYSKGKGNEHILDIGLATPVKNSIPFVFAKGCIDGGLNVKSGLELDEKTFNSSNTKYISELKNKNKKQFSAYAKAGVDPENLGKLFSDAKEKIMKAQT